MGKEKYSNDIKLVLRDNGMIEARLKAKMQHGVGHVFSAGHVLSVHNLAIIEFGFRRI